MAKLHLGTLKKIGTTTKSQTGTNAQKSLPNMAGNKAETGKLSKIYHILTNVVSIIGENLQN